MNQHKATMVIVLYIFGNRTHEKFQKLQIFENSEKNLKCKKKIFKMLKLNYQISEFQIVKFKKFQF